jgi:hypothetical protein
MTRISERARALVSQSQFDEALILLLELNHPTWSEPLRYACSAYDVVSNGVTYKAKSFSVPVPPQTKKDLSEITLTVEDIDREVARKLRQMTDRRYGSAALSVVLSGAPNTVEAGKMGFRFSSPTIAGKICTFTLGLGASLGEIYPFHKYRPATHPGLFNG